MKQEESKMDYSLPDQISSGTLEEKEAWSKLVNRDPRCRELEMEICRLQYSIAEHQNQEKERLMKSEALLNEKRSLTEERDRLVQRKSEFQGMVQRAIRDRDNIRAQVDKSIMEIDSLKLKSDQMRKEMQQYHLQSIEAKAEMDQLHFYDSGLAVLMYNMKEHVSNAQEAKEKLKNDIESTKLEFENMRRVLQNPQAAADETQELRQLSKQIQEEVTDLQLQSKELALENENVMDEIEQLVTELERQERHSKTFVGRVNNITNLVVNRIVTRCDSNKKFDDLERRNSDPLIASFRGDNLAASNPVSRVEDVENRWKRCKSSPDLGSQDLMSDAGVREPNENEEINNSDPEEFTDSKETPAKEKSGEQDTIMPPNGDITNKVNDDNDAGSFRRRFQLPGLSLFAPRVHSPS